MYSLSIKNFQSIKDASLKFRGFTTISGRSDIGKSAVRRALSAVLFNEWDKSFIRNGEKSCNLVFKSDDFSVECIKGSGENSFCVNSSEGSFTLSKVGKDQPKEIEDLGFKLFETSGDSYNLNVTTQLRDPLFIVAYKDSENTKIFNSLFKIDKIEKAQSFCASDLRSEKMRVESNKKEIEGLKLKERYLSEDLSNVESLYLRLESVMGSSNLVDSYLNKSNSLGNVSLKLERFSEDLALVDTCIKTFNRLGFLGNFLVSTNRVISLSDEIKSKSHRNCEIDSLCERVVSLDNSISLIDRFLKVSNEIESKSLRYRSLGVFVKKLDLVDSISLLDSFLSRVHRAEDLNVSILRLKEGLFSLESEIKSFNVCESCGRPL